MNVENETLIIDTGSYQESSYIRKEVEIFNLVSENHPALKKVMPEFNFENCPTDPVSLASSLVETCKKNNGLGLSANQCGLEYRVFVMGSNDDYVAFFNPKIISCSEEKTKMEEGCLSYKGLFLNIERPKEIMVEYQDYTGTKREKKFTGLTARCFQHELDHMNGITYHSHVGNVSLQMAMKRKQKYLKLLNKVTKEKI
jgi:peptide deformylase